MTPPRLPTEQRNAALLVLLLIVTGFGTTLATTLFNSRSQRDIDFRGIRISKLRSESDVLCASLGRIATEFRVSARAFLSNSGVSPESDLGGFERAVDLLRRWPGRTTISDNLEPTLARLDAITAQMRAFTTTA